MPKALEILQQHQLRRTPVRQEVLRVFLLTDTALSHAQLEKHLPDTDRVTLYRTLRAFEERGIIHKAIDGTEVARYALCHNDCDHHRHSDNHAHFHCAKCGETVCLEGVAVPEVALPQGYTLESTHLIIKGICQQCGT